MSKDPFVRFAWGLVVVLSVPYFVPILDKDQLWFYGSYFLDLPLLALVQTVFCINFFRAGEKNERQFWGWLIFGFSLWLVQSVIGIVFNERADLLTVADLLSYVLYFGFYAAIVMALEIRPHLRPERLHRLLLIFDRIGALIFLFGLLLYLTVLPALIDWETYWTSSLVLFSVLDVIIFFRLLGFVRTVKDRAWRSTYAWLMVASGLWFLTDSLEVLMWAEIVPYFESGTPYDLLWILALPVVVIAARTAIYARSKSSVDPSAGTPATWEALGMGPIVVYAVATPLFHLLFYRMGWADPALKSTRELLTVGFASVLALMAFAYQQWLRRENELLARQRAKAQGRLEHQAYHDSLTGLPNRRLFREHLALGTAHAQRRKNHCAVFFCDLDEFKVVNDSLGHATGDQFLVAIGHRLRKSIRSSDTVARLGGDEFAILVHDIESELEVLPVAEHLIAALRDPIVLGDSEHVFTASIGIALFPEDGTDEATLLRHADMAMYQAKLKGRNTYQLFAPGMNEAAENRLFIEKALRDALALGTFEVLYQPVINLENLNIVGCEALLRWKHPEDGLVGPDLFIDVGEQTGLIVPIGDWVLETACNWGQGLEFPGADQFLIAVNISPRQLRQPDFAAQVTAILDRTGLSPSRLQLEITESMAIEHETVTKVIEELRGFGITIAIDDLGTGFSGLSRLRDLPVDVVKIDRTFIGQTHADAAGEAIVQAIVGMARALDLQVIAEGVETDEQLDLVRKLGCDLVQGFLFHEPLVAGDVERLLGQGNAGGPDAVKGPTPL